MDVEKTPAPTCTCPSGDGSLRWPCPIHAAVAAINLHEERIGFVLMPLSPAAVAPHVVEFIMGFDFDEVRDVYGERFAIFWQGLVGKFTAVAPALYITTDLSADFACTLAQHLAARQPGAQPYSIDTDPAGIRARVADVITGTLMVGAQGHTPPPAGHWAEPFWQMARADAAAQGTDLRQQLDAARWRWVREQSGVTVSVEEADDDGDLAFVSGHTPEELDAAIDGQRNAGTGVGA